MRFTEEQLSRILSDYEGGGIEPWVCLGCRYLTKRAHFSTLTLAYLVRECGIPDGAEGLLRALEKAGLA